MFRSFYLKENFRVCTHLLYFHIINITAKILFNLLNKLNQFILLHLDWVKEKSTLKTMCFFQLYYDSNWVRKSSMFLLFSFSYKCHKKEQNTQSDYNFHKTLYTEINKIYLCTSIHRVCICGENKSSTQKKEKE